MNTSMVTAQLVRQEIDRLIKSKIGKEKFSMQICSEPIEIERSVHNQYKHRYETIKKFLSICEYLFEKSFRDHKLAFINRLILGEAYKSFRSYHQDYYDIVGSSMPLFFRTDEPIPGKIVEFQIPGSGFASICELQRIWAKHGKYTNGGDWANEYIQSIEKCCRGKPKVFYIPNSSYPDDRELLQKITAEQGLEYVDPLEASKGDFNYVKSHSFWGLSFRQQFNHIASLFMANKLPVEPPPTLLYETKIPLIFPFDKRTREYFTDDIRDMLPHSQLICPENGFVINKKRITYEQLCNLPKKERSYIVKYAGPDAKMNFGGKGVFSIKRTDKKGAKKLIHKALKDYKRSVYWIIQEDLGKRYDVNILNDDGQITKENRYARFSGFYGPDGLITTRVLFRNFYKVGGSHQTAIGILKPKMEIVK